MTPSPRPVGSVAWVDLSTPDVDAAGSFYAELLGWELEREDTPMGTYVVGLVPDGPAAGMMAPPPNEAGAPPAWGVFFAVADADGTFDTAVSNGASPLVPPMEIPGGARIAVVTDPAGAAVGMMQQTDEGSMAGDGPGAVNWVETHSRDSAASRAFYETVFGWEARAQNDGYTIFVHEDRQVAGMMDMPAEVPEEVPSYWVIYFGVPDVDAVAARAVELGGSMNVVPTTVESMRFAFLEDPLGAAFAVLSLTAD